MQHPSARRSARGQARPCNQAIGATTCIVFPDFVGGIVHRLACLPTNQRSRLCIRTNSSPTRREKPKPGQIRANRGRLVGRRQTDLSHWLLSLSSILLVDSLSRASGKAHYPLRRMRVRFTKMAWKSVEVSPDDWFRILLIKFRRCFSRLKFFGMKFISCRSMGYE